MDEEIEINCFEEPNFPPDEELLRAWDEREEI